MLHNELTEMDMTFYGWKPHTPGTGKRLDYIFFLGDIIPVAAEVITYNLDGRYPSDHMPVQVKFTK
jgi:endonuclease/exonuclease/phosphatase family metal-dependent hydrolase